jgi:hypothetical protein
MTGSLSDGYFVPADQFIAVQAYTASSRTGVVTKKYEAIAGNSFEGEILTRDLDKVGISNYKTGSYSHFDVLGCGDNSAVAEALFAHTDKQSYYRHEVVAGWFTEPGNSSNVYAGYVAKFGPRGHEEEILSFWNLGANDSIAVNNTNQLFTSGTNNLSIGGFPPSSGIVRDSIITQNMSGGVYYLDPTVGGGTPAPGAVAEFLSHLSEPMISLTGHLVGLPFSEKMLPVYALALAATATAYCSSQGSIKDNLKEAAQVVAKPLGKALSCTRKLLFGKKPAMDLAL